MKLENYLKQLKKIKVMTIDQLKMNLSQKWTVQLCKEGVVFTLLITGKGLSNFNTFNEILGIVTEATKIKYPNVEAIKNDDTFFCIILKP